MSAVVFESGQSPHCLQAGAASRGTDAQLHSDLASLRASFDDYKQQTEKRIAALEAALEEKTKEWAARQHALRREMEAAKGEQDKRIQERLQEERRFVLEEMAIAMQVELHDDKKDLQELIKHAERSWQAALQKMLSSKSSKLMAVSRYLCVPGGQFLRTSYRYAALRDWLAGWTAVACTSMKLLYKGTRHGWHYPCLLDCIAASQGDRLLLLMRHESHVFGCLIDGQLLEPPDASASTCTSVAMLTFISLCGACNEPTKIPLPAEARKVKMAGRQGAVRGSNGAPRANIFMGGAQHAALWMGYAKPVGPSCDLRSCELWIAKEHLPTPGYLGVVCGAGRGTLSDRKTFTLTEMEVWAL
ncbi:unnamed protein product [Vitrella brassicaformis CCMP3155]|uniref:TLDc domain-containing protein n=2 Tax=Vitrella brassicaformis TaxID=1169539 RepID=A0A0G4G7P0_VITBC|nr:unnamed protein product [Vitrella brassicaformis CCMP3155]|eukprot:CEM24720.1 unnamed protein product [Vitrella brassicaformis CCMP3155]